MLSSVLSIWCFENEYWLEIDRNCVRQSESEVVIFLVTLLQNMLSIKVFELEVIRVGEYIVGKKYESIKCPHNQMYFYVYYN